MRRVVTLLIAEEAFYIFVGVFAHYEHVAILRKFFGLRLYLLFQEVSVFLFHHPFSAQLLDAVLSLVSEFPALVTPDLFSFKVNGDGLIFHRAVLEPVTTVTAAETSLSISSYRRLQSDSFFGLLETIFISMAFSLAVCAVFG